MPLVSQHLIVDLQAADMERALESWRWLIGPHLQPYLVTAAGDVLLIDRDERIHLLDTGAGTVETVAKSVREFEHALLDSDNLNDWFAAPVVEQLRSIGVILGPGECYGYTTLPVFAEGSYGAENRFVLSALEHISFTADVNYQIRHLPDGAKVRIKIKK